MRITLSPTLQKYVEGKVRTGQYAKVGDVVRDALIAMKAQEEWTPEDVAELREDVMMAVRQLERGETSDFTAADIQAEGRRILAARKARASRRNGGRRQAS